MLLCIEAMLPDDDLASITALLAEITWVDGAATAGWAARAVKANLQASPDCPAAAEIKRLAGAALARNTLFQAVARPLRLSPLLVSRAETGMGYGAHVDDALMAGLRTDVSFTLFLSDPADYDGGALVIDSPAGEQAIRLPPGSAVVYPSTTLHRVETVTRGARQAVVGWAQSRIRDPGQRELLFDLETARAGVAAAMPGSREGLLLGKTLSNLLRMWAEG